MKKLILKITSILTICYMLAYAPVSTYININTLTLKTAEATTLEIKQKAFAAIIGLLATTMAIMQQGANYTVECLQNCYATLEANKDQILLKFSIPQLMAIIYGTASIPAELKQSMENAITADEVAKAKALHQKAYADHLISTAELAELGIVKAITNLEYENKLINTDVLSSGDIKVLKIGDRSWQIEQNENFDFYRYLTDSVGVLCINSNLRMVKGDILVSDNRSTISMYTFKILDNIYRLDIYMDTIAKVIDFSNVNSINYYNMETSNIQICLWEHIIPRHYDFADPYFDKTGTTKVWNLNMSNTGSMEWKNFYDYLENLTGRSIEKFRTTEFPFSLNNSGEYTIKSNSTSLLLPNENLSSTTLDIGWNSIPSSEEDYERPVLPTGTYKVRTDENGVPTEVVSADGTQTIPLNPAGTAVGDDTATNTNKFFEPPDSPDWPKFKNFFDIIFILIYLVMIVIKIYFKLIHVVINIASIPATTVVIEDYSNIMVGFNFIKNITVPVLNISLWTLIGYMFTVFYFIYMLKIIQSLYHAFSATGDIIARQNKINRKEKAKSMGQYGEGARKAFTKNLDDDLDSYVNVDDII